MTLCFTEALDRTAVIHAADLVAELIAHPAIAAAWTRESSCAGMSVGGLTRHLVSQPVNVVTLLRADPSEGAGAETIDLLEHYSRASWLREDLDGAANRSIRETADKQASDGPDAAAALLSRARAELKAVLADGPSTTYPRRSQPFESDRLLAEARCQAAQQLAAANGIQDDDRQRRQND
jgi:hypothetical protein